jgi:hypothetical protein
MISSLPLEAGCVRRSRAVAPWLREPFPQLRSRKSAHSVAITSASAPFATSYAFSESSTLSKTRVPSPSLHRFGVVGSHLSPLLLSLLSSECSLAAKLFFILHMQHHLSVATKLRAHDSPLS